jgi:hypothetical protein
MRYPQWMRAPGAGIAFALALLGAVEAYLHTDEFLYRFRGVFAAGRVMDKLRFVETHPPDILIIGNSRVDNGFDPATVQAGLPTVKPGRIFNFGMPGGDARTLYGILTRLARKDLLGGDRISKLVIGLDEALIMRTGDELSYGIFYADRAALWRNREYRDLLRSYVRLWGYSDNLKELHEPAKLESFVRAWTEEIEPRGGGAEAHLGYRAGVGELQHADQLWVQEKGWSDPPDPVLLSYFRRCLDLLKERKVETAIVFMPLLKREPLYLSPSLPAARPYLDIVHDLEARGIPVIRLDPGGARSPDEFVNGDHLNDKGAQRYSKLLAQHLGRAWPATAFGKSP